MLELCLQILFYVTPILYLPKTLGDRGRMMLLIEWNPLTSVLALVRTPILDGAAPALHHIQFSLLFLAARCRVGHLHAAEAGAARSCSGSDRTLPYLGRCGMALIQFTNVDLEYPVRQTRSVSFKEFIVQGMFRPKKQDRVKSIKALTDLTFQMHDGDRVGIIGLNGAGKSTLLRTIGGIYPIKRGARIVKGNICSLYEIQVGFDQDATGRQNIYYRSYLQGETPTTIKENLQQIEDFTELGHFLQLPIRCYSTGMLMRLAFSIATARHPEILLIDEVFATGDLVFQKKAEGASARIHEQGPHRRHGRP